MRTSTFISKFTGWFVLGTLIFYVLYVFHLCDLMIPTFLAWFSNLAMWRTLPKGAKKQVSILMGIGLAALVFAAFRGVVMSWQEVFAVNLPMLAMFVAVSFLDLTSSKDDQRSLPTGFKAILNTAAGVQLLGAVINLSVVMVFADRIKGVGKLAPAQQFILTRSFASAAWWSPFFVATGVALTYAPGMKWHETLIPGAFMAIFGIFFSTIEAYFRSNKGDFKGYPIRVESLFIPVILAVLVILLHFIWPNSSILILICLISPIAAIILMKAKPRKAVLLHFVEYKLPRIGSQFALFLAAGIFSNGIKAITLCYPQFFDLHDLTFTPTLFAGVLAGIIIAGYIGIHPVVSIAIVSPMLLPLHPDPTQLGFLFLSSWAISAGSSALTGLGLLMTSRYQIPAKVIMANSWHYTIVMWLLCTFVDAFFL